MELKERVIEAEGELCEALARASEVELEERDWVNALSHNSICTAIKLGEMHLQVTKAQKRDSNHHES